MEIDTTAGGELPTPAQIRAYIEVSEAARRARRMREASRGILTGLFALGICVFGTMLAVMHSPSLRSNGVFPMAALIWGYIIGGLLTVRRLKKRRAKDLVKVVDRREEAAGRTPARPRRIFALAFAFIAFQIACLLGWGYAFRHMSNAGILASLSIAPVLGIGFFVGRFVLFRFWEDLLFATCVALAYSPIYFLPRDLVVLSFLAFPLAIAGAWSLDHRWTSWARSVEELGDGDIAEEAGS